MSSRVHRTGDAAIVQAVVWRPPATVPAGQPAPGPEPSAEFRAQAEQLQHQYEHRLRDAHAAGAREGEAAGHARAAAELQAEAHAVIERLARAIQEIAGLRARLRAEAEADLVQLSLAIARRVLRREMAIDPDALHGLVLGALQKLEGQEIARVRVHPSHAAAIAKYLQQNLNADKIEIVADPLREIGSVVFETQRGNLDASVESQLLEIERGLADRLGKAGPA